MLNFYSTLVKFGEHFACDKTVVEPSDEPIVCETGLRKRRKRKIKANKAITNSRKRFISHTSWHEPKWHEIVFYDTQASLIDEVIAIIYRTRRWKGEFLSLPLVKVGLSIFKCALSENNIDLFFLAPPTHLTQMAFTLFSRRQSVLSFDISDDKISLSDVQ